MTALSNERDCLVVKKWVKSISNHVYWSAASSKGAHEDVIEAKWRSVMNHVQNIHKHKNSKFGACVHAPLKKRKWIKPGRNNLIVYI